jgi:hypothetical protein
MIIAIINRATMRIESMRCTLFTSFPLSFVRTSLWLLLSWRGVASRVHVWHPICIATRGVAATVNSFATVSECRSGHNNHHRRHDDGYRKNKQYALHGFTSFFSVSGITN